MSRVRQSDPGDDEGEATSVGDDIPAHAREHADLVARGGKLGRYVVVEKIGSGAMGTVYRAYDPELDRGIALKLVEIRAGRWRKPAEIRVRIMREAQAIARVQHPNVVQVFDVGEVDYAVWVAMEYVDGHTVKQWSRMPGRTWREVVHTFVCAAEGLAAAHRAEIVHRDFKPENVMVGRDGRIRVLDFGLARALSGPTRDGGRLDLEDLGDLPPDSGALDASLTAHGTVMGTPAYMAPEQHLGKDTSPATDQFALCVALWEALYGQRPFLGETHAALAFAATRGKIAAPPSDRSVPRWIHTALLRGLQPQPEDRFADMKALIAALEADPARRRRRIAVGVGFAGMTVAAALLARSVETAPPDERCTGARDKLAGVWDDARRDGLQRAFTASELPFAVDSFEAAATAIDGWAEAWVRTRTEACRATRVLGEQSEQRMDLRMTCLDRHLRELGALIDVLDTAERDVVAGAIDASDALPRVATCDDLSYLTARVPPPADPERARAVAEHRDALASVRARANAGAFRGLSERLDAREDAVTGLDHAPLSAEFFGLRASVQESIGDARASRQSWERTFALDLRAGDLHKAAFAAAKLVYIVGHKLSDREDGERWATMARELSRGLPHDQLMNASLWSAEASMLSMHGDYEAAARIEQKVIDYWLAEDPTSTQLGVAYGNLGTAELMRGRHDEAAALIGKELDLYVATYGRHHPDTGGCTARLASAYSHAGRAEEALPMFRRAIAVLRDGEGEGSTRLASAMDGLGRVLRQQDKLAEAEQEHRRALAVWRKALGDDHPDVAVSMMHVGYTLAAQEKWAEALELFRQADATLRSAVGEEHPQRIYAANSRATMLLMLDRPEEARPVAEWALSLDSTRQVDPTLVAETQFILAQALWSSEADPDRAVKLATQARTTYANASSVWASDLAKIDTWLSERRDPP
ncbi:MAG: serine/threonine-protein kinase [Myxococcota bacterium]